MAITLHTTDQATGAARCHYREVEVSLF